ncbi:YeeE/YedE family protein [Shewanella submarina]|uniref:YeeE/YedE thiosulfate transporter family protein n=1 Tax=Shewanella submarina TaxID=2016376 RepID=A0ABV7G693_9GAMM|nr:YeeE/YedE thiosulfate transporter family protein [Shewanella submarina]MCL1038518.1 YeeE/YedE family protein [Shewanella submarina]
MLLIISIILIAALGYLAQSVGLCMVRGVREASNGRPMFLIAIIFSGTLSWISILVARHLQMQTPFISFNLSLWAVLGGLIFGIGSAINNGCGVSTISRLARGHLAMAMTICGWLTGWFLLAMFGPDIQPEPYALTESRHLAGLGLLTWGIVVLNIKITPRNRKVWLSMLLIGLMASIVFLTEPHWTPSALLKDMSSSLSGNRAWPEASRFALFLALLGGMLLAAFKARNFKLRYINGRQAVKHLAAGVMMGMGAAVASGGNDTQLLLALPSFSPAGITTVFFILLGIYLGRRLISER